MTLSIWLEGKKYRFAVDFGWFKGNEFMLFDFQLLNFYSTGSLCLVQLQIAKFIIGLCVVESSL